MTITMTEAAAEFIRERDQMISREIERICHDRAMTAMTGHGNQAEELAMKYNTYEEVVKDYYRMEKDWGISITPVSSEEVIKKERWYALLNTDGQITSVCPVNPFGRPFHARDLWIPLESAPEEVTLFYQHGEEIGLAAVKSSPLVRTYRQAPMVISAMIEVKRKAPCNKIALCFSLEYDSADWSEVLPLPVTSRQIHEARVRLYDCAKDWAVENNVELDLGDEQEIPDKAL